MTRAGTRQAGLCARVLLACAPWLLACVEIPEFSDPSIVDRPRVLAIVAEPPEVNPGQDATLSLLLAGADSYSVSWRACAAFDTFGGSQYGDDEPDEGCGGAPALPLGEGPTALLPGVLTRSLFDDLEVAAAIFGGELPEATIERIRTRVGLPFLLEATIEADGKLIRAVKRVLISEREPPHRNPPLPHFRLRGVEIAGTGDAPFRCRARGPGVPSVSANREVELAPLFDGPIEPWLEIFQVIDLRGELRERRETAFYSWFSTAGAFEEGTTKAPLRNEIWRTPGAPGCYPLWLVVRDGHGGTSACGVDVAVGDATACD